MWIQCQSGNYYEWNQRSAPTVISVSYTHLIIVDKLGVEESEVTTEASFTNDLGADSLDTVELIMEFEKEFGISIPDDQAEKIGTVGDAVSYIEANACLLYTSMSHHKDIRTSESVESRYIDNQT